MFMYESPATCMTLSAALIKEVLSRYRPLCHDVSNSTGRMTVLSIFPLLLGTRLLFRIMLHS